MRVGAKERDKSGVGDGENGAREGESRSEREAESGMKE